MDYIVNQNRYMTAKSAMLSILQARLRRREDGWKNPIESYLSETDLQTISICEGLGLSDYENQLIFEELVNSIRTNPGAFPGLGAVIFEEED